MKPTDTPTDPALADSEPVTARRTRWQYVEIRRHPVHGHQLVIDGDLQIAESDAAYNTAMVAPLFTLEDCRRVAILGGGDGGVLNELLSSFDRLERPLVEATLIDIDPAVTELSREWLPRLCGDAFDDPRARVISGDAFAWLDEATGLDAVIYDLTLDPVREGVTRVEFIREVLARVRRALRPGGVLSMQACGEWLADRDRLLSELHDSLRQGYDAVAEQVVLVPSYGEQWTFLSARRSRRSGPD